MECVYTQTLGVRPDIALLTCNPQVGLFPRLATLTLTWGTSITLPGCQLDLSRITYAPSGFFVQIPCLDRRWAWAYAANVSGHFNVKRNGVIVPAYTKNLRQLATLLFDLMGEATADVSALPTTIYPEVRWDCVKPVDAIEQLLETYGYSVALNFGSEPVKVVQLGVGTTLPATNVTVPSITFDPKIRPRWVRVDFGESVMQCRFKLEPVAMEVDGTWVPLDNASYKPADGWEREDPELLPSVLDNEDEETYAVAMLSVRRAYRVSTFADGTLDVPRIAGSLALSDITQVLPLQNRGLVSETIRPLGSRRPLRLWAKHDRKVKERGQPEVWEAVDIDYEVTRYDHYFDGENAIVIFAEPLWYLYGDEYLPAEVYLEAACSVTDENTNAKINYTLDVSFDTSGVGYVNVYAPEYNEEIVFTYDDNHVLTGGSDNTSSLDAIAALLAAQETASLVSSAGEDIIYSIPKLGIRCDGAIRQVQHIMTEGERGHAVNRTRASRYIEFDKGIPSRAQRIAHAKAVSDSIGDRWENVRSKRRDRADD